MLHKIIKQDKQDKQDINLNSEIKDAPLNIISDVKPVNTGEIYKADNIISVDEINMKFIFFDNNKKLVGDVTIDHIIKYLGHYYDTNNELLPEIDVKSPNYELAKGLVKKYIFTMVYRKDTKYSTINIKNNLESPFMADVELLIKLNTMLSNFQETKLNNMLSDIDIKNRSNIEKNIKKLIFQLLNYTLKLIAQISEQLRGKDDLESKALKDRLLKYSIGIMYNLNIFIQEQNKINNSELSTIKTLLDENIQIKNYIAKKISK